MTAAEPPVTAVEVWSHPASARSTWVMVRVEACGRAGIGELSDGGAVDRLLAAARVSGELAVGQPLSTARAAVRAGLRDRPAAPSAFLRRTVLGGFESAFADLTAKLTGTPLSVSLGLGEPAPVRVYANLNRRWGRESADVLCAEAVRAVAAGYPAIKVAPFSWADLHGASGTDAVRAGLELARQVRAAVPAAALMIDCHHRVPDALLGVAVRGLADVAPYWVEDLVDVTDPAALRTAASITGLPLAGGEHVGDPAVAAAACTSGAVAYWLLDPKHAGGPSGASRIAAAVAGVPLTFHNPSGPVGTAHAAHLAGLAGATTWLEVAWGEADRTNLLDPPERIAGGAWQPVDGPGIGSDVARPVGVAS